MAKFSEISKHTEFLYANFKYIKISDDNALTTQGYGLIELGKDDEVTPLEIIDGKSKTDIT